jgi:hypothetical protein
MSKIMRKRSFLIISLIGVLSITGCIKETYNMNMLSKKAHISPTLAISAVKGDVAFSDMVKSNDTIVFDSKKLVTFIYKKVSFIDLDATDFAKGTVVQKTAILDPSSLDLGISDALSHISGDFQIINPSIKFTYTNSFPDSIKINLNAAGRKQSKTVNLSLSPFTISRPNVPLQTEITSFYTIDKSNSNLPLLISLPPEVIDFSGSAVITHTVKSDPAGNNAIAANHLLGSLELTVPMELKVNNLQFTDTVDNFLKDDSNDPDNPANPGNFQMLKVIVTAKNGFPLGCSLKMSLYDSKSHSVKNTVDALGIIAPATVDSDGKANGVTETTTSIEFTKDFFSWVNKTDKVIFRFTLNTTGNGTQNVKIYSDYRIDFKAALVVKPDINLK